jgi:hypothetical protein
MPIRRKGTRVVATAMPQTREQGRRAPLPSPTGPRQQRSPALCTLRLWGAICALVAVEGSTDDEARRRAMRHVRDMRGQLRAATSRDEERRIRDLMLHDGGMLAREVARSHAVVRPYVERAVLEAVNVAKERNITDTLGLAVLFRERTWSALERFNLARATTTTSGTIDEKGTSVDALKRAQLAGQRAGALLLSLGHVVQQAQPQAPTIDVAAAVRAQEAKRAALPSTDDEHDEETDAPADVEAVPVQPPQVEATQPVSSTPALANGWRWDGRRACWVDRGGKRVS